MFFMIKAFHIAWANVVRFKGAFISLFVIIMLVSALITTGLSLFLGVNDDYLAGVDRLGSLHSVFIMAPDVYNPSFENIISGDPRVSQYDISDAISLSNVNLRYGVDVEVFMLVILDLDKSREVSAPLIIEQDLSIAREKAIYLPVYSKGHGQQIGDEYPITYRNKQYDFIVAGFFETNDFSVINNLGLRFFVPGECFSELKAELGGSVWITVRFWDIWDSEQFNNDFTVKTGLDLSNFITISDVNEWSTAPIMPISVFSAIVVVFALLIALISLLVIRFRVTNTIENSMHEIGVLKASGYTSQQIVNSYLLEYGMVSLPAALFGILLPIPVFPAIRQVLASMTGFTWTLGVNMAVGIISSLLVVAVLLSMVMLTCRKIKKLPPVTALRGGIAANSFRHNFFPLHKGLGNAHIRLGFKNIFAFLRFYAMIGLVVAGISLAVTFMAVLYRNFVTDLEGLKRMSGFEISDISLIVARHTDAGALSADVAQLPEVRKITMLDEVMFDVD
jgi:putative ABC transport system permease protein